MKGWKERCGFRHRIATGIIIKMGQMDATQRTSFCVCVYVYVYAPCCGLGQLCLDAEETMRSHVTTSNVV